MRRTISSLLLIVHVCLILCLHVCTVSFRLLKNWGQFSVWPGKIWRKYQLQPAHHYRCVLTSYAINRYYVITQQSHWPEPQQQAYKKALQRLSRARRRSRRVEARRRSRRVECRRRQRRPCEDVWWRRQREDVCVEISACRRLRCITEKGVSAWKRLRAHVWVETWRKQLGDSLEIDLERKLPRICQDCQNCQNCQNCHNHHNRQNAIKL